MIRKIQNILIFLTFFLFLFACQKEEYLENIIFDNSLLSNISINSAEKEINISYEAKIDDPFIDHVMVTSPKTRIISWLENNIINFGTKNKIIINIEEASISKKEVEREVKLAGVTKNQKEDLYELIFKVSFILFNDNDEILGTAKAKVLRSTTSAKFISLNERDRILDSLTLDGIKDLSDKSVELIKLHMPDYIL
tara:strand:+ start:46 stop:633 length:588 start_codon:yes stop_codon:yes gene_type:complete